LKRKVREVAEGAIGRVAEGAIGRVVVGAVMKKMGHLKELEGRGWRIN
jgi:hypothetical protein